MTNISLRDFPDSLYQQIQTIARQESHSVNQQLLVLLEEAVQLQQRPPIEVFTRMDQARNAIAKRVGPMPDSTELIRADRDR